MYRVLTATQIGAAIRAERKSQRLTQARLAALCGVSPRFLIELEKGRATAGVGLVLRVLSTLGLDVMVKKRGSS